MSDADYEYLTHGKKIQVDSAIRDGDGYEIAAVYPKKIDVTVFPSPLQKTIQIAHSLNTEPSAVIVYLVHQITPREYEKIETDVSVTDAYIQLKFIKLPDIPDDSETLELLVRVLI